MTREDPRRDPETVTRERDDTKTPRPWKVVLHNDDFTTMEFVVSVLVEHFGKSQTEAIHITLQVHRKGKGIAGTYSRDVAETKVDIVTAEARAQGMPLKLTAEPA